MGDKVSTEAPKLIIFSDLLMNEVFVHDLKFQLYISTTIQLYTRVGFKLSPYKICTHALEMREKKNQIMSTHDETI